jgi:Zn-dependent protease
VFGISVFLHWSWAVVAVVEVQLRSKSYVSQFWNVAEYLTLFAIVLLHEFGHALACRSVGGKADRIMLWPLGGIAYVNPPPRAGALLWSIAAGPLVNVILAPIAILAFVVFGAAESGVSHDFRHYLYAVAYINVLLLVFNLLPVYPLDGGQILRAILWYFVGRTRSLTIAATIGLGGAIIGVCIAAMIGNTWLVVIAIFAALQSWNGLKAAKMLSAVLAMPRYAGVICPACKEPPPIGPFWRCSCGAGFDTFQHQVTCPNCQRVFERTSCPFCGAASPSISWYEPAAIAQSAPWTGVAGDSGQPHPGP